MDIDVKEDTYIGWWVMVNDDAEHPLTTHCMTYDEALDTVVEIREQIRDDNSQFGVGA